jgi:hypothetical protein
MLLSSKRRTPMPYAVFSHLYIICVSYFPPLKVWAVSD